MWLPSTRSWRVGLSAQRLSVARVGHLWRGNMTSCDNLSCAPGAEADSWAAATSALACLLAEQGGPAPTLRVVLSGRFVRWQLLPWRPELTRGSELAAYAALRFRETFGAAAQGWQVLHAPQPPGRPVPACAIDGALLEALRSGCAAVGARLSLVTPYFACAFDHWRRTIGRNTAWFALVEADCVSLALVQGGQWTGVYTQRIDQKWQQVLPGMLAQTGIAAGLAQQQAPLYLAGPDAPPAPINGLPFTWLQPRLRNSDADAGCRMAFGV